MRKCQSTGAGYKLMLEEIDLKTGNTRKTLNGARNSCYGERVWKVKALQRSVGTILGRVG